MDWDAEGTPDIAGMFDPAFGAMLLVSAAWLTPAPPIPIANIEAVVSISFRTFASKSARWQIAALSLPTPPVPASSRAIPSGSSSAKNPAIVQRHEPEPIQPQLRSPARAL